MRAADPRIRRRGRRTALALLFAALGICSLPGCASQEPEKLGDVVLISVDTLRPDHLGIYGYARDTSPAIDARFSAGAIYERAYSTEASTPPSAVSLLTGLLPQDHGVRLFYQLLPEATRLLTDRLPAAYQTAAFVSNVVLTEEALGLASRFDHYDDWVDEQEPHRPVWERSARRTTAAALAWLKEERDADRPLFLWVHYIDPHGPYRAPDHAKTRFTHEGRVPMEDSRIHAYQRDPGVDDALDYVDRYDEEIAYIDGEVEQLLSGYARERSLDDALVVFTADHGESMIEHERWFTHGYHVYEEIIRVPLLVLGPGVEARRDDTLASLIDVAPTVLRFAGGDVSGLTGRDLRFPASASDPSVFAEASGKRGQLRAAIRGDQKSIVRIRPDGSRTAQRLAYDLAADPGELRPRPFDPKAPAARELLELIERDPDPAGVPVQPERGERLAAPKVSPRAGAAELEKLRALGYVE
ncbi:MAG: sulfatase [Myxococcota bacterium]